MKVDRKKYKYLYGLTATLVLHIEVACANQHVLCVPEIDAISDDSIEWQLEGSKLTLMSPTRINADDQNYVVENSSVVLIKGDVLQSQNARFFNNNWAYNTQNGNFTGKEDRWTLYKNETVTTFNCMLVSGQGFPNRKNIHTHAKQGTEIKN